MELVRRTASASRALGGLASAGRGADVSRLEFGEKELTLDDIPASFPTGRAIALASDTPAPAEPAQPKSPVHAFGFIVRQEPKPRRRGVEVVQRRIGWSISTQLDFSHAHRPLRQEGSVYKPSGSWVLAQRTTWSGPATKSSGKAAIDTAAQDSSTTSRSSSVSDPYADEPTRFPEGSEALAYLPASVRRSVYSRVSTPSHFDGKVVRYEDNMLEIVVVRGDASQAVGVIAHLPQGATTWDVAMYSYGARHVQDAS